MKTEVEYVCGVVAVIEKGAEYLLALKGNQHDTHKDVRLYFEDEAVLKRIASTFFDEKGVANAGNEVYTNSVVKFFIFYP